MYKVMMIMITMAYILILIIIIWFFLDKDSKRYECLYIIQKYFLIKALMLNKWKGKKIKYLNNFF